MSIKLKLTFLAGIFLCALSPAELALNVLPSREKTVESAIDFQSNLRQVVIPHLVTPPAFDGSGKGWENAYKDSGFKIIRKNAIAKAKGLQAAGEWESFMPAALKPNQDTTLALGFDEQFLYLRVDCLESAMDRIVGFPNALRDSPVYSGDCIDLTIAKNRDNPNYFQIVVDCNAGIYDTKNFRTVDLDKSKKHTFVSDKSWSPDYLLKVDQLADRWRLFLGIPFAACEFAVGEGDFIDINICRNEMPYRELSAWGANESSFHEADKMIRLWLGRQQSSPVFLRDVHFAAQKFGRNQLRVAIENSGKADFTGELHLETTADLPGGGKSHPLSIAAGKTITMPISWIATTPGLATVNLALRQGTAIIGQSSFQAMIAEPLQVYLGKQTFFSSSKLIPCRVELPVANPAEYSLRLSLSESGKVVDFSTLDALSATNYKMDLNVAGIRREASLKVELVSKADSRIVAEKLFSLSRTPDPFEEE